MEGLKPKYNYQAFSINFSLMFFIWFIAFYFLTNISIGKVNTMMIVYLLVVSFVMALIFGIVTLFATRRITIKTSYKNKDEFIKKINILLFQIGYVKEFNQDNFYSYKPSLKAGKLAGNIDITLNQEYAEINGPIGHIKKLNKVLE